MGGISKYLQASSGLGLTRLAARAALLGKFMALSAMLDHNDFGAASVAFAAVAIADGATNPGYFEAYIASDDHGLLGDRAIKAIAAVMYGKAFALGLLAFPMGLAFGLLAGHADVIVPITIGAFGVAARATLNPGLYQLQRKGESAPLVLAQSAPMLLDAVLSVGVVMFFPTAAAALGAWTLSQLAVSALTYAAPRKVPLVKPSLDRASLRGLGPFARKRLAANALAIMASQLDDVLVARLYGLSVAGVYGLAYRIAHSIAGDIGALSHTILFPRLAALRRLAHPSQPLEQTVFRVVRLGALAAFGSASLALIVGDLGLDHFRGTAAQVAVIILAFGATVRVSISLGVAHRLALDDATVDVTLQPIRLAALVAALFMFRDIGVAGAAMASTASLVVASIPVHMSSTATRAAIRFALKTASGAAVGLLAATWFTAWDADLLALRYGSMALTVTILIRRVFGRRSGREVGTDGT